MSDKPSTDQPVVADTHVHLYDCYDWVRALAGLARGLGILSREGVQVGFLAEKAGVHALRELSEGASARLSEGTSVTPCTDGAGVVLENDGLAPLYIIGGRQVATSERIEILALTVDADIPDGITAAEAIDAAEQAGGIAVLSWAPGKWLFRRRRVVEKLLADFGPERMLLADTTLRPCGLPEPGLLQAARKGEYTVLAGSDPLPLQGEERWLGTYASLLEGAFDPQCPVLSARSLLRNRNARPVGRRCSLPMVMRRLLRNATSGRGPQSPRPMP